MRISDRPAVRLRIRRVLWQPPRPHGEQPRERVVGPLGLFYDLVVVVLVAQAAHRFAGTLSWRGLGEFGAVFGLIWIAWINGDSDENDEDDEDASSATGMKSWISATPSAAKNRVISTFVSGK